MFPYLLYAPVIFISVFGLFGYISLASIISAIFLPLLVYILEYNSYILITSILAAIFIIYRHKDNIKRLFNGTEKKITNR